MAFVIASAVSLPIYGGEIRNLKSRKQLNFQMLNCKDVVGSRHNRVRFDIDDFKTRVKAHDDEHVIDSKDVGEKMKEGELGCKRYTVDDLRVATNNFRGSLIGYGGYGFVFKATLDDTEVAIKVFVAEPPELESPVLRKQFEKEFEVLSSVDHPNIIKLIGVCPKIGGLVYEYMNNGSLKNQVGRGRRNPILWGTRIKIAADIARALQFLHTRPNPLVHRDVKPSNILLDKQYNCKLADFGFVEYLRRPEDTQCNPLVGTPGFIDPEFAQENKFGTESDIYSFGVTLFSILTGWTDTFLIHADVERAFENDTIAKLLDPYVEDWPVEEAVNLAKLAWRCIRPKKSERPDLSLEILPELNRLKQCSLI